MTEIEKIHDKAFDFLFDKYIAEDAKGNEFYFRTRLRFKGKEKLWFLGNNHYAALTFWTGNDYKNKSPNIYFEINVDGRIMLFIVGRENDERASFFEDLAMTIQNTNQIDKGLWMKLYTDNHQGNYLSFLSDFLSTDKLLIDNFLDQKQSNINATIVSGDDNLFSEEFSEEFGDEFDVNEVLTKKIEKSSFHHMLSGVLRRRMTSPNYYFNKKDHPYGMPLGIKSLEVRNFRGIEKLKIDGIPVDTKWIVLTGENGFGKSSVLQSIAIGLFGNYDGNFKLLDDGSFVGIEAIRYNENLINFSINYKNEKFYSINKQLAVYGATRLNIGKSNENYRPDLGNVTYNLFFSDGTLTNIETELKESFAYNLERFNLLRNAFCLLIPDLKDIIVDISTSRPVVKYIEKDSNNQAYKEVYFEQLASGFRNIIGIVGDIVARFSLQQNKTDSLHSLEGIVIIDEIELHLHPKYQKSLPLTLSTIFPNIQFIVSTHSPIPLLGMPKETALLKVNRNQEAGITIERLDVDINNLLPNAILSSPIFGFQDIIPVSHDGSQVIDVSDNYNKIVENDDIQKELESFLSDDKTAQLLKLIKK